MLTQCQVPVMTRVDRADYVLDPRSACEDSPQLIGHGATISAPQMLSAEWIIVTNLNIVIY
ncbi:hypothetical protein BC834DRAFT_1043890 [Gloeopeniophorella convolvens]|nr:hypothetical protein BC834DRAFT_1043890 [Gloeopeniophorella convolvens]